MTHFSFKMATDDDTPPLYDSIEYIENENDTDVMPPPYFTKPRATYTGMIRTYYDDNTELYEEYYRIDGLQHGQYTRYYKNGYPFIICNYINNEKDGEYNKYYENGQLNILSNYKFSKLDGEYKEFYNNGNLKCICNYINGRKEGEYTEYHDNGQRLSSYNHMRENFHGQLKCIGYYVNGDMWGEYNFYDENGRILSQEISKDIMRFRK